MAAQFYDFLRPENDSHWNLSSIVQSKYFTLIMLGVVVSNTIVMIFETYDRFHQEYSTFFLIIERIYLSIYIVECGLKLWVYSWKYFKSLWNSFDLFIIGISIIDLVTHELTYNKTNSSLEAEQSHQNQDQLERIKHFLKVLRVLRVLRSFRALRVLRTIRFIQSIHTIVKTCAKALPAMASITFIMIIITCISAIMARSLFGESCPEKFSNLVKTFFSLFVLLTLDDWYSVYQACEDRDYASFQLIFCLIYIFIINFILLNLLMAVLVDSFQNTLDSDKSKTYSKKNEPTTDDEIAKNLDDLIEQYCVENRSTSKRIASNLHQQKTNQRTASNFVSEYYKCMECLEFRMERHEQLTKLAQKSIKLLLNEQDSEKASLKK